MRHLMRFKPLWQFHGCGETCRAVELLLVSDDLRDWERSRAPGDAFASHGYRFRFGFKS